MWSVIWVLFVIGWPIAVACLSKTWRDEALAFVKTLPEKAKTYFDLYSQSRKKEPQQASMAQFTTFIEEGKLKEARQYVEDHPDDETLQRLGKVVLTQAAVQGGCPAHTGDGPVLERQTTVPTTDGSVEDDGSASTFSLPAASE